MLRNTQRERACKVSAVAPEKRERETEREGERERGGGPECLQKHM